MKYRTTAWASFMFHSKCVPRFRTHKNKMILPLPENLNRQALVCRANYSTADCTATFC